MSGQIDPPPMDDQQKEPRQQPKKPAKPPTYATATGGGIDKRLLTGEQTTAVSPLTVTGSNDDVKNGSAEEVSPTSGRIRPGRSVTFSEASSVEIDELDMYPVDHGDKADEKPREGWDNKVQFLLGVISYAVGLGNVWRFPYLCQQNGGGAFLIPYGVMMLLEGMPLFLIEMGIGQRLRVGPIGVWNAVHPYLGGVGIASAVVSFLVALYYNVIITWCLFYLGSSFQSPLPWADCPAVNETGHMECTLSSETSYFWYRTAIDTTSSISDLGGLNLKMVVCLVAAWLIVYLCVMKGIKTSGKVMYVTATFPYFVTTAFLIRSVMLEGAGAGVAYMFTPDLKRLIDPKVWMDAATQIFYSMGLAFGGLIAFASYNPIKNNVKSDVITLSIANIVTSMYTAITIFCILGYKGQLNFNKCIDSKVVQLQHAFPDINTSAINRTTYQALEALNFESTDFKGFHSNITCDFNKILADAAEGTGLAFIVFTQAMVEFPGSPFWAVLFFLMLLMLGLGSMFGTLEGVITSVYDLKLFPWLKKPVLTGILCGFSCVVGLIFVTRAGEYWVKLFDAFAGSYALMAVAFFEIIGVVYVYGWRRFCRDIQYMTGEYPNRYWQWMWRFISPSIMLFLFVASFIESVLNKPTYHGYNAETAKLEKKDYPTWCMFIAGTMVLSAMLPVPFVWFVRHYKIMKFEGDPRLQAAKRLGTTPSTTAMLESQQSFHRLSTGSELNEGNGDSLEALQQADEQAENALRSRAAGNTTNGQIS